MSKQLRDDFHLVASHKGKLRIHQLASLPVLGFGTDIICFEDLPLCQWNGNSQVLPLPMYFCSPSIMQNNGNTQIINIPVQQ